MARIAAPFVRRHREPVLRRRGSPWSACPTALYPCWTPSMRSSTGAPGARRGSCRRGRAGPAAGHGGRLPKLGHHGLHTTAAGRRARAWPIRARSGDRRACAGTAAAPSPSNTPRARPSVITPASPSCPLDGFCCATHRARARDALALLCLTLWQGLSSFEASRPPPCLLRMPPLTPAGLWVFFCNAA